MGRRKCAGVRELIEQTRRVDSRPWLYSAERGLFSLDVTLFTYRRCLVHLRFPQVHNLVK